MPRNSLTTSHGIAGHCAVLGLLFSPHDGLERVFKTLMADAGGTLTVAIVPVTGTLDLKALAAALGHKKAAMVDPAVAQRRTGYVLGGISPLGQRQLSPTVLDETALLYGTIYVSGGRRGFDVELSPTDLLTMTGGTTANIAAAKS